LRKAFKALGGSLLGSVRDLAPVVLVVMFFQLAVLQQPIPNLVQLVTGLLLVVLGLTFFIRGLEMGLFPIGESLAHALARKGSLFWLLVFAFTLGFGTTVAEPALIAVAEEAAEVAADAGAIEAGEDAQEAYANGLRLTVALSVGFAILLGVVRILKGWPMHWMIISGYVVVVLLTTIAPREIIGIAYDSGGVTTSTITVPLVTALGIGLATSIRGRNPMIDGFGLIAFASLTPMIFVMVYGMVGGALMLLLELWQTLLDTIVDVLPIATIIAAFQFIVIRRPIANPARVLGGFVYVLLGLTLFLVGLEEALFPLGRLMASQLTNPAFIYEGVEGVIESVHWADYVWVYIFAFAIGFSTTIAEPALLAVAMKANQVSAGAIGVWGLRIAVALGVAVGISLGTFRIVTGLPIHYFIIVGYIVVVIQTIFAPRMIIPLAYDSGGVTTSTVTVPLVAALGLGLAETVPGRNVLIDGFGLIAFASLFPMMSVMAYAQLSGLRAGPRKW
jgi:hypothetical protein